jgi:Acetyl-CoA hydrolase/transferase C-terminal domain
MMVTALGAAISDTLEDGRVVSGVGGQHDLVTQAFALDDARSLMSLRATREAAGQTVSNIVWRYGQTTVSRHCATLSSRNMALPNCAGRVIAIASLQWRPSLIRASRTP